MDASATYAQVKVEKTEGAQLKSEKLGNLQLESEKLECLELEMGKLEDAQVRSENTEDVELKPQRIKDVKEEGPSSPCDLFDVEVVYKIAQELLLGLATACVDNTTGSVFQTPAMVAVDIRKEMVEYLTQRSEFFVAESSILEGGPGAEASDHPYDVISLLIDDFVSLKRNWFSRVSGWLLSEMREDRVDDFVQEMELNSFWLLDGRDTIAQTLLKNVDFKNMYQCNKRFRSEELAKHRRQCGFRSINCDNEGCTATFSAALMMKHDSTCPFKVLPCEQKCSEYLVRREMDRHCITVCPMRLVNCPFYSIGCQSPVPQCMIKQHFYDNLHSHMLYTLQFIHKQASVEDLKQRAEQIEKSSFSSGLAELQVVRFFVSAIKDIEEKLGPFQFEQKHSDSVGDPAEEISKAANSRAPLSAN